MNPIVVSPAGSGEDPRVDEIITDVVEPFLGEPAIADTPSQIIAGLAIPDPTVEINFTLRYGPEIAGVQALDYDTERDAAGVVAAMQAIITDFYPAAMRGIVVEQAGGIVTITAPGILPLAIHQGAAALGFVEGQSNTGVAGTAGTGVEDRLDAVSATATAAKQGIDAAARLPRNAEAAWSPTEDATFDFTNGGLFDGMLAFDIGLHGATALTHIEIAYADVVGTVPDPTAVNRFDLMQLINAAFDAAGVDAFMGINFDGAFSAFSTYTRGVGGAGAQITIEPLVEDLGGKVAGIGGAGGTYYGADSAPAGTRLDQIEENLGVNTVFTKEVVAIPGTAATILGDTYTNLDFTSGGSNNGAISFNVWVDGGAPQFVEVDWALANANAADPSSVTINEFISLILPQVSGIAVADEGGAILFTADAGTVGTDSTLEITGLTLSGDFPPTGSGISNATAQGTAALTNTLQMTTRQAIQYLLDNS